MTFAIIIPTYEERKNLEKLLPTLAKMYPKSPIYVVDDNSKDSTFSFVSKFSQKHKRIKLIIRKGEMGRGGAVIEGLKRALTLSDIDYFLEMDADFSHHPSQIKRLTDMADPERVVVGSRYVKGSKMVNWPKIRRFLSFLANLYIRIILKVEIADYTNGFRLYPRSAVEIITKEGLKQKGYALLSESAYLLHKKGYSFVEVPTTFVNRERGKSKTNWKKYLKSLAAIVKIRFNY